MLRSLSVGKWTVKGCSDIIHVIDTHRIALEHSARREGFISDFMDDKNGNV